MNGARGRYSGSDEKIARIVDTAFRVFLEQGYHNSSLRQIAAACGLTDGGLLHYFPSKSHLLSAVARRHADEKRASWSQLEAPLTFFEELGLAWRSKALSQENPRWIEFSVAATSEGSNPFSRTHADHAEMYRSIVSRLTGRYQICKDNGELRPEVDPAALARARMALATGYSTQWVLEDQDFDMGSEYLESLAWLAASVSTERLTIEEARSRIVTEAGKFTAVTPSG